MPWPRNPSLAPRADLAAGTRPMRMPAGTRLKLHRVEPSEVCVVSATGLFGWIGLVPLATGLLSTCPLYTVLSVNTCLMKT